ncbi:hypothetical protein [Neisseria shayeganii]|uniref:Uncharacterized protein n=1 Tax=Neisseria shayeganii TaxID=607712 RepID=A0A7D7N6U1_9NEIS|nr:hypothetical protein [Neisseria shayeganii]QMT41123.1 hypothetical protein H3L94_03555 [Neisseria shayeganii]
MRHRWGFCKGLRLPEKLAAFVLSPNKGQPNTVNKDTQQHIDVINHQPWRRMMKPDVLIRQAALCLLLLFLGAWLFNHFPYPLAGIALALAYPLFLIYQYAKKVRKDEN